MTETSFTIDELEELYALFKVSSKVNSCPFKGMKELAIIVLGVLVFLFGGLAVPQVPNTHKGEDSWENKAVILSRKCKSIISNN